MSEAHAHRDHRLFQRAAALLSEDYPLEQLIERLCDTLCSELGAQIAFVALSDSQGQLAINGVAQSDPAALPDIGPDSSAREAFATGMVSFDARNCFATPIVYRERTLGVIGLRIDATLDEEDQREIAAIARYLAIAVRNLLNDRYAITLNSDLQGTHYARPRTVELRLFLGGT